MLGWVSWAASAFGGVRSGQAAGVARRSRVLWAEKPGPSPFGKAGRAAGAANSAAPPRTPAQKDKNLKAEPKSPAPPNATNNKREKDASEFIRLDNFMKLQGMVETGGQAKLEIQDGQVTVNREVETRRGRKLREGDVVDYENWQSIPVEFD